MPRLTVGLVIAYDVAADTGLPGERIRHFAALAAFIAGDDAEMITGQMILCDGGGYLH
ncbi:MAG TPA: hypothetical protein VGH38_36795 [Bryobacteraceae bacterium]